VETATNADDPVQLEYPKEGLTGILASGVADGVTGTRHFHWGPISLVCVWPTWHRHDTCAQRWKVGVIRRGCRNDWPIPAGALIWERERSPCFVREWIIEDF
jgi:hypothetical protein